MDMIYRLLIIIIIFTIFMIIIAVWLWYCNPYYFLAWWNRHIKDECDKQDASPLNGIPSYHDAWECPNKIATELHRLIRLNHDDILNEVMEIIATSSYTLRESVTKHDDDPNINNELGFIQEKSPNNDANNKSVHSNTNNELGFLQEKWLNNENKWNPIWIRFMGNWIDSADRIPTLKRIVSLFPEVVLLHVSIFYPGYTLIEHRSHSRAFFRYHYGLKIPENDVGLKIAGFDIKWKEKEGFVWDNTLPHSAWNHTSEPRIVIFADIFRDLSLINSTGSRLLYSVLKK